MKLHIKAQCSLWTKQDIKTRICIHEFYPNWIKSGFFFIMALFKRPRICVSVYLEQIKNDIKASMPTLQMCIYEIQQTQENSTNNAYRRDKTSKDSKRVHLSSLHVDNKRRFEIKVVVLYIYFSYHRTYTVLSQSRYSWIKTGVNRFNRRSHEF